MPGINFFFARYLSQVVSFFFPWYLSQVEVGQVRFFFLLGIFGQIRGVPADGEKRVLPPCLEESHGWDNGLNIIFRTSRYSNIV